MIRLSIVIPAFNAEPYLSELLDRLSPQITKDVEVLVIDDGSREPVKTDHEWCTVIRQKNQGVSSARNAGIDKAKGDYISFIDSDDLVSEDFISKILEKTKDAPDIIEFSWKSLTDKQWKLDSKLNGDNDRLTNPSVWCRVFKRSFIGDTRFNTKKDTNEDEDFSRRIGYLDNERSADIKVGILTEYLYFYRDDVPLSKIKRFAAGFMTTKKIVYYYEHVTKEMTWLLDEIKKEDETNAVWLFTNQNDIPELKLYCRISKPRHDWAHIARGEKTPLIEVKKLPYRTQVVIYRKHIPPVGGIGTFIQQFIDTFWEDYDITILCSSIYVKKYEEYSQKVNVIADTIKLPSGKLMQLSGNMGSSQSIVCDSLIVVSFMDPLPGNVYAKQKIRMCHACKTDPSWEIPQDYDRIVYVSETAMLSHGVEDGQVIHNLYKEPDDKALLLVSATRFPAPDKGQIEKRMRTLANMLNDKGISYIWLNFADGRMQDPPKNFYNMGISDQMPQIIKAADYLVQLSDSECWSYACLEALSAGTALICTPFPSIFEMGVKDKVHAHVIPFDMDFDVEILKKVPHYYYDYDNDAIKSQWRQLLGDTTPIHDYEPIKYVMTEVIQPYRDVELNRDMGRGEHLLIRQDRAAALKEMKFIKIIGE